jgi:hypothetical protein
LEVIMSATTFSHTHTLARRLRVLAQLFQQGQASALMERTLDKLLVYEAEMCREQLQQLRTDLAEFEQRYSLSSAEFYRQYHSGQTDDGMDYVEWASLIQMTENLEKRLAVLTGEATAA